MALALGILISGAGTNMQNIAARVREKSLHADIRLVISNHADAPGLARAKELGLPTACLRNEHFNSRELFDRELVRLLHSAGVTFVALAGFMRLLSPVFLHPFAGRVVNIHPSLLPACPGLRAQERQVANGVRLAGCTVHFVDEKLDHGPIIIQGAVPAYAGEDATTLGMRILEMEHRIYPQALEWIAQDRVRLENGQAVVDGSGHEPGLFWTNPPLEYPFSGEKDA